MNLQIPRLQRMTARGSCSLLSAVLILFLVHEAAAQPTIGPRVRCDPGGGIFASNETSGAASDANPAHIVTSWNDWRQSTASEIIRCGVGLSLNGGATWSDFLLRPPMANQSSVEGDPMAAFDPRTGNLWVGAISFASNGGVYIARKNAGDAVFQPSVMARVTSSADKCWVAAGPALGDPNLTRVYIAYNQGVLTSTNMGDTWSLPVSLGSGLGFLPRVGPGGEIYVAYWDGAMLFQLKRSLNGGTSYTTHTIATRMDNWGSQDGSRFPGTFRVPPLVYLDVDMNNGHLYAVYFDTTNIVNGQRNVDLYFTKSTNQGTSWTAPVIINTDASPPGDQFWPWLEVDRVGRLHMVFLDSRHTVQNDGVVNGMFDAYYSYSVNAGATWTEHRLTTPSWNSNNDGLNRPTQFLGDYLGLAVAQNKVYPFYIDTSGGDPDVYTHVITFPLVADIERDGDIDEDDLNAFAAVLVGAPFNALHVPRCDINGDGQPDGRDVKPYADAYIGGY